MIRKLSFFFNLKISKRYLQLVILFLLLLRSVCDGTCFRHIEKKKLEKDESSVRGILCPSCIQVVRTV